MPAPHYCEAGCGRECPEEVCEPCFRAVRDGMHEEAPRDRAPAEGEKTSGVAPGIPGYGPAEVTVPGGAYDHAPPRGLEEGGTTSDAGPPLPGFDAPGSHAAGDDPDCGCVPNAGAMGITTARDRPERRPLICLDCDGRGYVIGFYGWDDNYDALDCGRCCGTGISRPDEAEEGSEEDEERVSRA